MRALGVLLLATLLGCSDGSPAGPGAAATADPFARPAIQLDPERVPEELRDLIPLAEQWGIGDDVLRGEYEERSSEAKRRHLRAALQGRSEAVEAWLDSLPPDRVASEEAGAFLFMLEAFDEMGPTDPE